MLRLICMLMILVHHLLCHVYYSVGTLTADIGVLDTGTSIATIINAFCYVGVNVFILISGYFGLTFNWLKLVRLYLLLLFYTFLQCIINCFLGVYSFTIYSVFDVFFPLSHFVSNHWWFMKCYVIFFILAPLVNTEYFEKKKFQSVIGLLFFVNVYLGYYWGIYSDGFTVAQFLFLYVIGRYLKRYVHLCVKNRNKFLVLYLCSVLLYIVCQLLCRYIYIPHWRGWLYNNPLVVVAAIGLFCYISTFKFHSKVINNIASSAISLYLLQNFDVFKLIYIEIERYNAMSGELLIPLSILITIFIFVPIALCIDRIRLAFEDIVLKVLYKYNIK